MRTRLALQRITDRLERLEEQARRGRRLERPRLNVGRLDYSDAALHLTLDSPADVLRLTSVAKEPWTTAWLHNHLRSGDVVWDVGANVGAYALIAATIVGDQGHVVAIEPAAATDATLCRNVTLNGLGDMVAPLAVALAAGTGLRHVALKRLRFGGQHHALDGDTPLYGSFAPVWRQPVISARLDELAKRFGLPGPTDLKVDVYGGEVCVVEGASATLADGRLRSVLVEMHDETAAPVGELLAAAGQQPAERWRPERPSEAVTRSVALFTRAA